MVKKRTRYKTHIDASPVAETYGLELFICKGKSERPYQGEAYTCSYTGVHNIARILRNLGLKENNFEPQTHYRIASSLTK